MHAQVNSMVKGRFACNYRMKQQWNMSGLLPRHIYLSIYTYINIFYVHIYIHTWKWFKLMALDSTFEVNINKYDLIICIPIMLYICRCSSPISLRRRLCSFRRWHFLTLWTNPQPSHYNHFITLVCNSRQKKCG